MPSIPTGYRSLLNEIGKIHTKANQVSRSELNRAILNARWEIGRIIVEAEQDGKSRAGYGLRLIESLAEDLKTRLGPGYSERNLGQMRKFYNTYNRTKLNYTLGWAHYRELLRVQDEDVRARIEKEAINKNLSVLEVIALVQSERNPTRERIDQLLRRPTGRLYTYRVKRELGDYETRAPLLDLGFSTYLPLPVNAPQDAEVFHSSETSKGYVFEAGQEDDLYLYRAQVREVIDGDTLLVYVDAGFGVISKQKLRLRNLDAPELTTERGREVKAVVEARLRGVPFVLLRTRATDLYDRYLADVLLGSRKTGIDETLKEGLHLNRWLVEEGLAVAVGR